MEQRIFNTIGLLCILGAVAFAYFGEYTTAASPWIECKHDYERAREVSGIDFKLPFANYEVHAMHNLVEVIMTAGKNQYVLRKSLSLADNQDISGNSDDSLQEEPADFNPNVMLRKKKDNVYVMYFTDGEYRYSVSCDAGMAVSQAQQFYNILIR